MMVTMALAEMTNTSGLSRLTVKVSSSSSMRSAKMVMFTHCSKVSLRMSVNACMSMNVEVILDSNALVAFFMYVCLQTTALSRCM